ncbi:MAG: 30S ribosomal protein S15 [Gammaproteobacteria bacterium]|nr:30S ribosomal protein S15 [Pseudomonadota bacterium]MCH9662902.1 30S ribosomal protein S15 [Gammaproteobacteria bacterium]
MSELPNPLSREEIVSRYRINNKDCGSAQVQVALLTARIADLSGHFKKHRKDIHSHRGLLSMVSRRRRLLKYLRNSDLDSYKDLISALGLRR